MVVCFLNYPPLPKKAEKTTKNLFHGSVEMLNTATKPLGDWPL